MKKLIAIFFIAALSATLLPGVLSWDQKKVTLFSTIEEEQPDQDTACKSKDDAKEICLYDFYLLTQRVAQNAYARIFVLLHKDPFIATRTLPPDLFC